MGFILFVVVCVFGFFWVMGSIEESNNDSSSTSLELDDVEWNESLRLNVASGDEDDDGWYIRITSAIKPPDNSIVIFRYLDTDNSPMETKNDKSIPSFFEDDDGDFCIVSSFGKDFFVPFGVLDYEKSGIYHCIVTVVTKNNSNKFIEHGRQVFHTHFPAPRKWYKSEYLRPLIGLMMSIARLDGELNRESVKVLRKILEARLEVPKEEDSVLKNIIKSEPSSSINELAYKVKTRYSHAEALEVFDILVEFSQESFLVHPQHRKLLDEIAIALDVPKESTPNFEIKHHYDILGVNSDASLEDIRRAYRLKMKDFHPDKYVNSPKEFQDLAHRKSIEIRESYDYLIKFISK